MLTVTSEKFGHAKVSPSGEFEAGSYQSFEYLFTAGLYGIDDTGGIKILFRLANDQSRLQFEDPMESGYTTVELPDNTEAEIVYDARGNKRPWYKMLQIKLVKGNLQKGDTITVRIGDRRQGSPGLRLQTFCQNDFEFRTLVDAFSNQNYLPLPSSPRIKIVPGTPERWKAVLPTLIKPDDTFRFSLKCEDLWGNPSDKLEKSVFLRSTMPVDGLPEKIEFISGKKTAVIEGLKTQSCGLLKITLHDTHGKLLTTSNILHVQDHLKYRHFWGDLHGQSCETVGTNTARDYFEFARDCAFLDMTGHQGNDFQISGAFWEQLNQLSDEFNEPNRFLTLPGYEWSGNSGLGGDRNVYYLEEGAQIHRSSHALVPDEPDEQPECFRADILLDTLANSQVPSVVFAHVGGRFANLSAGHNGRVEHSVEIHSAWGTFEWLLHEAFKLGYRVGVVCHSDDHKCRPGASHPGASLFGSYGGLTCYLMPQLTRLELFEAIQRRHHFGTTGARISLDVRVPFNIPARVFPRDPSCFDDPGELTEEALMGDIVQVFEQSVRLLVNVNSTVPVERVELYDGLNLIETIRFFTLKDMGSRIRVIWEGAENKGRGRTVYWNGELNLRGNVIRCHKPINFWNIEQQPQLSTTGHLSWQSVTTGNSLGVDLWLDSPDTGILSFQSNQISFDLPVSEIGINDREFNLDGLSKRVRLFRLPDKFKEQAYHFERQVDIYSKGDTRIYVKVILEDGHTAWSSPMYLFR